MSKVGGGTDTNLVVYWSIGDNQDLSFGANVWLAQTFTLTDPIYLYSLCTLISPPYGSNLGICRLFATDMAGAPTGSPIAISSQTRYRETTAKDVRWLVWVFDSTPYLSAGIYACVMDFPTPIPPFPARWRLDELLPIYPSGKSWRSLWWGAAWAELPGQTFMFEVWGWTPPPDPPVPPVINNWAPLDEYETSLTDGFTIVVQTDIECHLFMRWTIEPPLKHPVTRFRRGIRLLDDVYYCFVSFTENEQLEPGDTYIHTFEKRNWPICETRYFYFVGIKRRQSTPSATAIFTLHREEPYIPTQFGPVIASTHNRDVRRTWGTWPLTHDPINGTIMWTHDAPWFRLQPATTLTVSYWIYRTFLDFDTSPIPPGSIILSGHLTFYVRDNLNELGYVLGIMQLTQGVQNLPVIISDYGAQLPYTTVGGQVHIDDMVVGTLNNLDLNSSGLSWVNPAGTSRFCLRHMLDINDDPPTLGASRLWIGSAQSPAGERPTLTLFYVPP